MKRLTNLWVAVCAAVLFVGLAVVPMAFGDEEMAITCQNSATLMCAGSAESSTTIHGAPAAFTATITETGAKGGVPNLITLPFSAFGGDVVMDEPSSIGVSDVVEFNSGIQNFGNHVFEFSEVDKPPDPNDFPVPPGFVPSSNFQRGAEVGNEGANGVMYVVKSSDGTINAVYTIVSDQVHQVPEPGTLWLLSLFGLGGGLALLRRLRRKV